MPFDSTSSVGELEDLALARFDVGRRRLGSPAPRLTSRRGLAQQPGRVAAASLRISPPAGFSVAPVMPDSSIALALTNAAWPLACVSRTGLLGDTLSSDACSRKAFDVRGRPRRPLLLVPAAAVDPLAGLRLFAASADHRHDLVPAVAFISFNSSSASPIAGEMAVALDEARDHELPLEIDHLSSGRRSA